VKIAFFELEPWEIEYIKRYLGEHDLLFIDGHLNEDNVSQVKDCDVISIFIYSAIREELLSKMPNLKLITTMSTGFDHINLDACKKRNITVCNVPSYGENTVAEYAMGLLLSISRKLPQSIERVKRNDLSLEGLRGFDLKGKTIGIIGTGRIGEHMIRICKGFDMNIIAFDPYPKPDFEKKYGMKYVDLNYLLANSDIISLHAPYNQSTHHLINKNNINLVKRGCVLINTARGGLIETEALLQALNDGIISAAGLDVLEGEETVKEERQLLSKIFRNEIDIKIAYADKVLVDMPNVFVTPHNAFNSTEALTRILDTTIENIRKFISGAPVNTVK